MNNRYYSSKQEKTIAQKLNGRKVPNSGATPFLKGDVECKNFLIECKTQLKPQKSYSIKKEVMDKIEEERFAMRKAHCAVCFDFGESDRFYIVNEKTFIELNNALEEQYEVKYESN